MDITRWSTQIRLIIFFAAKDGEALYSQQKQDQELTVAQTMNSAVATGLEEVSFHSNPKERQCQRMLKLPHNCTHLTR